MEIQQRLCVVTDCGVLSKKTNTICDGLVLFEPIEALVFVEVEGHRLPRSLHVLPLCGV